MATRKICFIFGILLKFISGAHEYFIVVFIYVNVGICMQIFIHLYDIDDKFGIKQHEKIIKRNKE